MYGIMVVCWTSLRILWMVCNTPRNYNGTFNMLACKRHYSILGSNMLEVVRGGVGPKWQTKHPRLNLAWIHQCCIDPLDQSKYYTYFYLFPWAHLVKVWVLFARQPEFNTLMMRYLVGRTHPKNTTMLRVGMDQSWCNPRVIWWLIWPKMLFLRKW